MNPTEPAHGPVRPDVVDCQGSICRASAERGIRWPRRVSGLPDRPKAAACRDWRFGRSGSISDRGTSFGRYQVDLVGSCALFSGLPPVTYAKNS